MIFGKEINNLITEFYSSNQGVVLGSFLSSSTVFIIESVVVPRMAAKILVNTNNLVLLKENMIKLALIWVFLQIGRSTSDILDAKVEPALSKFINDRIVKSAFFKHEMTHNKIDTSVLVSRIIHIRLNFEGLVNKVFVSILPRLSSIFLIILNFWFINKRLGTITLILVLLQFSIMLNNIENCINKAYDEVESRDKLTSVVSDKFDNIHTISSVFGGIEKEIKSCENQSFLSMKSRLETNSCVFNKQLKGYVSNTFIFSLILVIIYKEFSEKRIDMEGLSTILLSMNLFFNQMYVISCNVPELIRRIGILNNNRKFIEELFDYKNSNGSDLPIESGKIEFKNVNFSYNSEKVITDKNVKIDHKEIIALFGTSGSGKTTFVKLIMKIISPQSGTILLDDKDINNMNPEFIKKYVTYISQDMSTLFNDTILYNIVYGTKLEAMDKTESKEEVLKLIYKYNIQNIYKNVGTESEFLDYIVGKTGETLSGGQRQMIHLIRAILNTDSKILILDEPTSALDLETKNNVIEMIKNECRDKTVLIITHDEDIKNICDRTILFGTN